MCVFYHLYIIWTIDKKIQVVCLVHTLLYIGYRIQCFISKVISDDISVSKVWIKEQKI